MRKYLMLMAVLAGLLLSACDTAPPTDWCYVFDFRGSQNGFALPAGTWVEGYGLSTDETGLLQASFQFDRFVLARSIVAKVVRGSDTGAINAGVRGGVFAVAVDFDGTLPDGIDEVEITKVNPTTIEGNDVNFTLDTGSGDPKQLYIESLRINGDGSLPFNQNSCAGPTLTPDIQITGTSPAQTPSASPTGTPTGTAVDTNTPGPSPTPEQIEFLWYYGLSIPSEMSLSNALLCNLGFSNQGIWPGTVCGDGTGTPVGTIDVDLGDSYRITRVELRWEYCCGNSVFSLDINGDSIGAMNPLGPYIYTDEFNASTVSISYSAFMFLDYLKITYEPLTTTPTPPPTSTAGPTNTPGPTSTAEPLWTACLDFATSDFAFTGIDATYEDGLGWVQDAGEWTIWRAGIGPSGKKKFKFEFTGAWAGSIRLTNTGGTPATGWKLGAGSSFIINFADEAWTPTNNLFIEFDGNFGPYTLQKLCWVDQNPSTSTPGPGTGTPLYTRTPLASLTAPVNLSRTPVVVPPPVIVLTSSGGGSITATPMWGTFAPETPTGEGPGGTPSGSGTPTIAATGGAPNSEGISSCIRATNGLYVGNCGQGDQGGLGAGLGEALEILGFLWNIGWGLFGALIAYIAQVTTIIVGLLTAFGSAIPQPIPGLPLCMSNPTAHDLCAIYYIMDWTLFAPATPGAFIIPLVMIVMNIYIAIYFVRWVIRIVRRGESVTDAG
jgi:hypothetical protein